MNNELIQAALRVKTAADMTLPLEQKPAPEPGSQPMQGMTNTSTYNPASPGFGTYAGNIAATALAKAKEKAQMLLGKFAAAQYGVDANGNVINLGDAVATQRVREVMERKPPLTTRIKNTVQSIPGRARGMYADASQAVQNLPERARGMYADASQAVQNIPGRARGAANTVADYVRANPKRVGAGAAALAGLTAAGAYGYHRYKNQGAEMVDPYAEKVASVMETGVSPEEAYAAMDAAEAMYLDSLEKIAFAEELYTDALDYFDEMEKTAAEYAPMAGSALGGAIGATAGLAAAGRFAVPRAGMIGAAVGGAIGGALGNAAVEGAPALAHFAANARDAVVDRYNAFRNPEA